MAYTTLQDLQLAILSRGNSVLLGKNVTTASDTDLIMASVLLEKIDKVSQLTPYSNINSAMVVLSKGVSDSVTFLATLDNLTTWLVVPANVTQFNTLINTPDIAAAICDLDTLFTTISTSTTALNLCLANAVFMNAVFSSTTASTILFANAAAVTAFLAKTAAHTLLANSAAGMDFAAGNTTLMTTLAGNAGFMTAVAGSTVAMNAIAGNSVAYTKVFASQIAMQKIAVVTTAMAILFEKSAAYTAMLVSTTAMTEVALQSSNISTILERSTLRAYFLASSNALSRTLSTGSVQTAELLATDVNAISTLISSSTNFGYVTAAPAATRKAMFSKTVFTNAMVVSSIATSTFLSASAAIQQDFVYNLTAIDSVVTAGQTVSNTFISNATFYAALFASTEATAQFVQNTPALEKLLANASALSALFGSTTASRALLENPVALEYTVTTGYSSIILGCYSITLPIIDTIPAAVEYLSTSATFVTAIALNSTHTGSIATTSPVLRNAVCTGNLAATIFIPNVGTIIAGTYQNNYLPAIFTSASATQAFVERTDLVTTLTSSAAAVSNLIANQTALAIFASDTTALNTLFNSSTARPLIFANAAAVKTITSNSVGSVTFAANAAAVAYVESNVTAQIGWMLAGTTKNTNSYSTVSQVLSDSAAMAEVVASVYAVKSFVSATIRTALLANSSANALAANSAVACGGIASSGSTTLNAFFANTTFINTMIANQASCDAIILNSGQVGMQTILSNATYRPLFIQTVAPMVSIAKSSTARLALNAVSEAMVLVGSTDQAKRILLLARSTKLYSNYPTLLDAVTNSAAMTELVSSGDIANVFPFYQITDVIGSSATALAFFINDINLMKNVWASKGSRPSYNDVYSFAVSVLNNTVGRNAVYNSDNALAALQANPATVSWFVGAAVAATQTTVNISSSATTTYTFLANGTKALLLRLYTYDTTSAPALCFARGYTGGANNTTAGTLVPITGENLGRVTGAMKGHSFDYSDTGVPPTANTDNSNLVCAANGLTRAGGSGTLYVTYITV